MNNIELNAVLYYADFLSLKARSIPVTDTCKYFYIHNAPINSAYIADVEPVYDKENQYFKQARDEYILLRDKFGEDGVLTFIDNIANLSACGAVGAVQMLKCIHRYSEKHERKTAFNKYHIWKNNQKYTHIINNDDGTPEEHECSKYIYHHEKALAKRGIQKSISFDEEGAERTT